MLKSCDRYTRPGMLPLAAHPLAHCSATRIKSRVGFGSRSKLPSAKFTVPNTASTNSVFVTGDDHVACATCMGRPSTPTASGDTRGGSGAPGVAPVHVRQMICASQKAPTLLRGVTCHVTRALPFSNVRSEYSRLSGSGAYSHFGLIAGVQVVIDVGTVLPAASRVGVDEIPRAIAYDRAAERSPQIVDVVEPALPP